VSALRINFANTIQNETALPEGYWFYLRFSGHHHQRLELLQAFL
jgi:hypothetical protein